MICCMAIAAVIAVVIYPFRRSMRVSAQSWRLDP